MLTISIIPKEWQFYICCLLSKELSIKTMISHSWKFSDKSFSRCKSSNIDFSSGDQISKMRCCIGRMWFVERSWQRIGRTLLSQFWTKIWQAKNDYHGSDKQIKKIQIETFHLIRDNRRKNRLSVAHKTPLGIENQQNMLSFFLRVRLTSNNGWGLSSFSVAPT